MINGSIIFEHNNSLYYLWGNGEVTPIAPVNGDGSPTINADFPHLSPDGREIVFTYVEVPSTGQYSIAIMDINGSNVQEIVEGGDAPAWSPDGSQIAFHSYQYPFTDENIYTINPDGSGLTQLTFYSSSNYRAGYPTWSPDGSQIAFSLHDVANNTYEIYVMDADGDNLTALTNTGGYKGPPRWSPVSNQIVFEGASTISTTEINVVNTSTGVITQLTDESYQLYSPAWSPDGAQIVFTSYEDRLQVRIMNADGSNIVAYDSGLTGNHVSEYYWGNIPPIHDGAGFCPICYVGNDLYGGPSLRLGEKRETVTDLIVHTPSGPLDFTRTYRQSKQGDYQHMGLGWTHNHHVSIDTSISGKLIVHLPNGGQAHFTQIGTTDQYAGDPGSNSMIDVDTGSSTARYTLTASDQSIFVFDDQERIRSRQWPNGEEWTYHYFTSGVGNGKLSYIDDGYGRQLQFEYKTFFDEVQLWRIGDHETDDLDDESLVTGRYIEFSYTDEKLDGSSVTDAKPLLETVQDVRDKIWTYRHYGQESGEDDADLANFLVEVVSPLVDTDGDLAPDDQLVLKHLTYTLDNGKISAIRQERGFIDGANPNTALLSTDYTFFGHQTTEEIVDTGLVTTHKFSSGLLYSSENPGGDGGANIIDSRNFRPINQVDANGNETGLVWSADGKRLEAVTDALDNETGFTYDAADRLIRSTDAEGRQTFYDYGSANAPRQPSTIIVSDGNNRAVNGDMELNSDWTAVGSPTTSQQSATEVDGGDYAWKVIAASAGDGIESADWTLQADHPYLIVARVFPVNTGDQVKMKVSGTTAFDVLSQGDGAWETLWITHKPTSGGTVKLQFLAEASGDEFYVDNVFVIEDTHILRWQDFTYNTAGQVTNEQLMDPEDGTTALQEVQRTYYPDTETEIGARGLLQRVTQIDGDTDPYTEYTYDSAGRVILTQQTSNFGSCEFQRTVYDAAGNVTLSVCGYEPQGTSDPADWEWDDNDHRWEDGASNAIDQGSSQDQNRITATTYDALGRAVQVRDNQGLVSLTLYDALDRVVRTITNYRAQGASKPLDWVWNPGATPEPRWEDGAGNPIDHGSANTQNVIADTDYNDRGLVRLQRDVLGHVTLLGYDDAGRLVKTVQNASAATYNNDYSGTSPDPDLSAYTPVNDPDQDSITEQLYDPNGNLVTAIDVLGRVNRTVYDALNRPLLTIGNYVETNPVSDPADWEWANNQWEDGASNAISHGSANDQNLISATTYDALGRVVETRDVNGQVNRPAYDALGRQTHQIVNYVPQGSSDPADWIWNPAATPDPTWEDGASNAIDHGSANDQNLVTQTIYNAEGRVIRTLDVLGNETHYAYDGLGRQIETITNYEDGTYAAANSDADLIRSSDYDDNGRVFRTTDPQGNVTLIGYDDSGRQVRTIQNASNDTYNVAADTDLSAYTPAGGATVDQDRISQTEYDSQGRVLQTTDAAGIITRSVYDELGRRVRTVVNYTAASDPATWVWANRRWEDDAGNAIDHGTDQAENIVSETTYNIAGQVVSTRDVRGTLTSFTYDAAGRRLTTTLAAGTYREAVGYTCYDKAGRVLRTIQNWLDDGTSPDAQDGGGDWLFAPTEHGPNNDHNLITEYEYDGAGRRISVTDPAGNVTITTYFVDGQVDTITDPEDVDTLYRYDQVRRRTLVVQNWVDNGEDPADWVWDTTQWEESDSTAIAHGSDNDQNIIVQVSYDKAGRMLDLRDPRGNLNTYDYDKLGRRLALTNPLSVAWTTAYSDLVSGGTRTVQTMPGINGGSSYSVQRDFDRLGRLSSIQYGDPTTTPDVAFSYDAAGNRSQMTEYGGSGFTSPVRETTYGYDDLRRLTSVGFDTDADSTVDETVSYEYDTGGLRTRLTLPGGSDSIQYLYDARGQLVQITDWDGQITDLFYDGVGRHRATKRPNRLVSSYRYDPAGRLRRLRHSNQGRTRADFQYLVDGRGNRTQADEVLALPSTLGTVYSSPTSTQGTWTTVSGFQESTDTHARLSISFPNSTDEILLTYGVGADHSIFDVYINGTLWESLDGYAASAGERTVNIPLRPRASGNHVLEVRNRRDRNASSSGSKLRFKQVQVVTTTYTGQSIQYTYDALSRLQQANYDSGDRIYNFDYDLAGNRLAELLSGTGVTPTNRYFGYNAANQLIAEGDTLDGNNEVIPDYTYAYDANGNLLNKQDTTPTTLETYTWDRANRLLTAPGSTSYQYDGIGNRIQQTVSSVVTDYLLDTQPGLAVVLRQTTSGNVDRFVHGPRGIHAQQDNSGDWFYPLQDGLGSVRAVSDAVVAAQGMQHYAPYGQPFGAQGSLGMPFGFTGEQTDANDLVYLRARYLSPGLGMFASLDPFEGLFREPLSLNGYIYVEADPINSSDPSGMNECVLFNDLPSFSPRRFDCERVRDIFAAGRIPVFDLLGSCYACMMDNSIAQDLTKAELAQSYHQGLIGAARDGFIDQTEVLPLALFYLNSLPDDPEPYQGNFTDLIRGIFSTSSQIIGGYVEGVAGNASGFGEVGGGFEVVYNFKTLQRLNYAYASGGISSSSVGVGGQIYVGHVENFQPNPFPNPSHPNHFKMFHDQYDGAFDYAAGSISGGVGITGGIGVAHFYTSGSSEIGVYGDLAFTSASAGVDIPIPSINYGSAYYYPVANSERSYILPNCKADTARLILEISVGVGSPLGLTHNPLVLASRSIAAAEALIAAVNYNRNSDNCC